MNSTSVAVVAGARPNFMKIAPVLKALDAHGGFCSTLIHTGQHYDSNLSDVFFDELRIRQPDVRLSISGVTHATQTAQILAGTEAVFAKGDTNGRPFDFVVVVGDVNSTMAATIAVERSDCCRRNFFCCWCCPEDCCRIQPSPREFLSSRCTRSAGAP